VSVRSRAAAALEQPARESPIYREAEKMENVSGKKHFSAACAARITVLGLAVTPCERATGVVGLFLPKTTDSGPRPGHLPPTRPMQTNDGDTDFWPGSDLRMPG
jgi:hypothetical protein